MPIVTKLSPEFHDFLIEARAHSYASPDAERLRLGSGATEIPYEAGDWLYTDNFVGGQPFGGYEHVSARHPVNGKGWLPIWCMAYKGEIEHPRLSNETLFGMLSEVLVKPELSMPIRGPLVHLLQNNWGEYRLRPTGRLETFTAFESIGHGMRNVAYEAHFMGGLINRDPELEKLKPKWLA